MDASESADDFVPTGLSALGIEADEDELQMIGGVHQIFWPPIRELLDFETEGLQPETRPDFSKAPQE
jgi:hypothetical protein